MAGKRDDNESGGWLGVLLLIAIVFAAVLWVLSLVGHALGLTPTFAEVTDRPDGWVSAHYRGVVWGYLLTLVVIGVVAAWLWLAVGATSENAATGGRARGLGQATVALAIAVVVLPIGQREAGDAKLLAAARAEAAGAIPDLVGMSARRARDELDELDLRADFRETPMDDESCRVTRQEPEAGAAADEHSAVDLRCRVKVPQVVGRKANAAQDRMISAGLFPELTNEPDDYVLSRCRVARQSRSGSAPPQSDVRLRLKCRRPKPAPVAQVAATTPAPPSEPDCDPNYAGACLDPDASDYDCAGGSGDGPEYTGTVTVVGSDVHDLNRDDDNIACDAS